MEQATKNYGTSNSNSYFDNSAPVIDIDDAGTPPPSAEQVGDDETSSVVAESTLLEQDDDELRGLTRQEIWNLTFALFAWASTVSNVTLVVGTSAVVLISIGGDNNMTSLPLGTFFFGSSLVSLLVTPWLFVKWGRKLGFLLGVALGMIGTSLGLACIALDSPSLLMIAMLFFGMAMGVGFFLRFAVVEVVPTHWTAEAVTLVVSGGVIAAFCGPESAQASKDMFDKEYMGIFFMTGLFNLANAMFISLISFPTTQTKDADPSSSKLANPKEDNRAVLLALLRTRHFLVPMLVSALTWSIMGMPMSIVRVVMGQVGYTSRESLTTVEFHFVGMYAPGFITGALISRNGPKANIMAGIFIFGMGLLCNFLADEKDDDKANMSLWIVGMFLIGVAWNFCFTSATLWTTALYKQQPLLKPQVQAANDCSMFIFSGVWLVSASFIFEKGGSGVDGWRVLNWVVVGLVGSMGTLLLFNAFLEKLELQNFQLQPNR